MSAVIGTRHAERLLVVLRHNVELFKDSIEYTVAFTSISASRE